MSEKYMENNRVCVIGEIVSNFSYSHEFYEERFYTIEILVRRISGTADIIPVMISEKLVDVKKDYVGRMAEIRGQFRSYNRSDEQILLSKVHNNHEEKKNKLVLSVFVQEICILEEELTDFGSNNQICLEGYLCKPVIYRKTPKGREIADILLAVNRMYGKSDYIPCIAWGRNARFAYGLETGAFVRISGRVQSREYEKKLSETESELRVAYEVSANRLDTGVETAGIAVGEGISEIK